MPSRCNESAIREYRNNVVAQLVPLGKDATELCINPKECNRVIDMIEKELFFLRKEWVWFPDDMESELDWDWEWVIKPSKKEMARRT